MLKLIVTQEAKQDLVEIGRYTESQWGRDQREKYIKRLVDRIYWLADNPQNGKDRSEVEKGDFSYSEGKHHIFYFFDDESITIIGVLHERMDFKRHL